MSARMSALRGAIALSALTALAISASPSGAAPPPDPVARARTALAQHPGAAHATAGQAFRVGNVVVDRDGSTHVRFDRTYRDLPVRGGDLVVHQAGDGAWEGVSQTLDEAIDVDTTPTVTRARAARAAAAPDKVTRRIHGLEVRDSRLVVDATFGEPRLTWELTSGGTYDDGTPSRLLSYVDAHTGRLVRREEQIDTVDGDGYSLYGGHVSLQLTQSGTSYQLKDPTRGGTYTVDVNNGTDSVLCSLLGLGCPKQVLFTSPDPSFGDGTTASRESAGVDAQYGTNETWDYYQQVHGRQGIFGDGRGSYNRVHYGKNYVNAFWDGTRMTYGDGDGTSYGPLVSLDVAGHEMSHGVTENTAKLTYSGEPGGLNEATSDIFGSMVERYAANQADPADYYIGEEFDLKQHDGFRRMDDPAKDGSSHSCWSTTTKNVDVHYSSGVGNHFFYLLAEGSGTKTIGDLVHSSPTCDGSTVFGIGASAAEKIWFRALTVYMTSGTDYAGARAATLKAAADLYGAGSSQQSTVAAAWRAVNVN